MQLEEVAEGSAGLVVVQVAIVVRDLDATIREYRRTLGWGPWRVYDFGDLDHVDTRIGDRAVAYTMRTALCRVGAIDFEIIEPIGPSPYADFIAERGEGLHHIQVRSTDPDTMRHRIDSSGLPFVMGGRIRLADDPAEDDASLEYQYHDGAGRLHLYVESTYGDRERLLNLMPTIVSGD